MAVTEVSIANMALSRVGQHNQIAALSDSNEGARQCNLHYEPTRDSLLRSHPWNFAVKRIKLINQAETAGTITGATQADPVVITVASHGYSDGDRVRIASVGGMTEINGRYFTVDSLNTNTFSLLDEDGTAHTAYTSGGTARKVPASEYNYWFVLPTDCLRVLNVDDDVASYKIEGGRLLYNSDTAEIKYIAKITDPTVFDAQFVKLLSAALAVEISVKLTDNANLKESLKADLQVLLNDARVNDVQESGSLLPVIRDDALTDVAICNMALAHVGSSSQMASMNDLDHGARLCNMYYEYVRDALLRSHPWNFAIKRVRLVTQAETAKNITAATAADPVVLTVASHGYTDGERVRVEGVVGMTELNGREFTVDALTTNTFSLVEEDGSGHTAYTSGGTVTKIPASEWSYWYTLPTDCMRVLNVDDDLYEYKIEAGRILSNDTAVNLKYVYKVTDPTLFDAQFVQLMALSLAAKIAPRLTDNFNIKESIKADLAMMMREARTYDAQEGGTPDNIRADTWVNSRL